MQADMVLEKELEVLHLDLWAAEGDCVSQWAQLEHEISKLALTVTHFLQQGHTA